MALAKEKYPFLFKMLASKTLYEAGIEFEMDKHYKDSRGVTNAVYNVYRKVLAQPESYGVSKDTVDLVKSVVSQRAVVKKGIGSPGDTTLREKIDEENNKDFKDLVLSGRKKAFSILNKKMDRILDSKKELDQLGITAIAQTFGILFDKAQIIQGEATENVAVLAKIDKNMSSEEALASILKMREINNADKEKGKKK